jgi:hypothetical protein
MLPLFIFGLAQATAVLSAPQSGLNVRIVSSNLYATRVLPMMIQAARCITRVQRVMSRQICDQNIRAR